MGIRQGCAYVGAWIAATTAAVVLSWFGVRGVLHDAVVGHVPPLPPRHGAAAPPPPAPPAPTTSRPPATSSTSPTPTDVPRESTTTSPAPPDTNETDDARVRGFDLAGGRVVLAIHPDRARLVSAVPKPGFQVRTWRNEKWLRVDMIGPQRRSSLFATWNGHPPTVRTVEH